MDRDPQTHREPQSEPYQIAEGLVDGRKTFALRTAHAYRHGHERPNEQRSKSNDQNSHAHRDGRFRHPDVRGTGLLLLNWSIGSAYLRVSRAARPMWAGDLRCAFSPFPSLVLWWEYKPPGMSQTR
jgi:hypothetical protein